MVIQENIATQEPLQIRKRYIKVQLQLEPMDGKWLTANMK